MLAASCFRRTGQHRAAAADRAAQAAIVCPHRLSVASFNTQLVVDEQLVAYADVRGGDHKNALSLFDRFAVRRTGMIEPARAIAAAFAIDDASIGQSKKEGMAVTAAATLVAPDRTVPHRQLTLVFENPFAGPDRPQCKHAFAVHW